MRYAIADVAALVRPGGAVDREARERGVTLYLPDRRTPLHPGVLGEGAASLLPGQDRPALLWTIDLDASGEAVDVALERATVRGRSALSYRQVQERIDAGTAATTGPWCRSPSRRSSRGWTHGARARVRRCECAWRRPTPSPETRRVLFTPA